MTIAQPLHIATVTLTSSSSAPRISVSSFKAPPAVKHSSTTNAALMMLYAPYSVTVSMYIHTQTRRHCTERQCVYKTHSTVDDQCVRSVCSAYCRRFWCALRYIVAPQLTLRGTATTR
jgi:hypothetical protein